MKIYSFSFEALWLGGTAIIVAETLDEAIIVAETLDEAITILKDRIASDKKLYKKVREFDYEVFEIQEGII